MRGLLSPLCAFVLLASSAVLIAAPSSTPTGQPQPEDAPVTRELLRDIAQSRFLSRTVQTTNREPVGRLWDAVMNWAAGKPEFAVIQLFGNVEQDSIFVAVPWEMLHYDPDARALQISATKPQLRNAPEIKPSAGVPASDAWADQVNEYWGQRYAQGAPDFLSGSERAGGAAFGEPKIPWPSMRFVVLCSVGALLLGLLLGRFLPGYRTSI